MRNRTWFALLMVTLPAPAWAVEPPDPPAGDPRTAPDTSPFHDGYAAPPPGTRVASAGPKIEVERRAPPPGDNEISVQLGMQASFGGTTPAGPKLLLDYARRLSERVW